ncbi:MAG TPA: carboxypeptidase-like regulatory domain-containing protein [Polyangiales bacterium]|nr:carboxypeptidase-like regulatory domain-containing protein [Polyangiales bacterium]
MRIRPSIHLIACCVFTLAACGGDDKPTAAGGGKDKDVTALRGAIKSTEGQALSGVKVTAGSVSARSGADGRYELRAPAGKAQVRFELDGYVGGFRSATLLDKRPTQLDVALLPLAAAVKIDASSGGMVEGKRGARVMVPAGAFVDSDGKPATGMVDVFLTPLDPGVSEELAAAPSFVAERDGKTTPIESFGMMDITARLGDKDLDVASGKELELAIPVASGATAEPTIDLWSFDEARGLWVSEGEATYDEASKTYKAKAKHMSLWNADKVYLATCICGLVEDDDGKPLPGARVQGMGVSYLGTSDTNTGTDGKFCLAVRKDSDVDVAAYHASTGGQSRRIESGSEDTMVPPKAGDARCKDAGKWSVKRDVFVASDGTTTTCGSGDNPFASGCAKDLGAVFADCYRPEGKCTINFKGTDVSTRYENGVYSESTGTGSKYYSASGKLCLTASFGIPSSTDEDIKLTYTLPDKRMYTMTVGAGGGGDYVIGCPDGSETRITTAQQQALQACTGGADTAAQADSCTIEGTPGGIDAGIGFCKADSDCSGGTICCEVPMSTVKFCFDNETCKLVQSQK